MLRLCVLNLTNTFVKETFYGMLLGQNVSANKHEKNIVCMQSTYRPLF